MYRREESNRKKGDANRIMIECLTPTEMQFILSQFVSFKIYHTTMDSDGLFHYKINGKEFIIYD